MALVFIKSLVVVVDKTQDSLVLVVFDGFI